MRGLALVCFVAAFGLSPVANAGSSDAKYITGIRTNYVHQVVYDIRGWGSTQKRACRYFKRQFSRSLREFRRDGYRMTRQRRIRTGMTSNGREYYCHLRITLTRPRR